MARALGGSLLTVDGKQHGAYVLGGSKCVDDGSVNISSTSKPRPPTSVAACDALDSGSNCPAWC